jgi:ribosomal protein S18 acetylase RimI-like enzyme
MRIRPFRAADTDPLYQVCLQTFDGGGDASRLFPTYPRLPGHLALGACLKFYSAFAFVLEADAGPPVGYAVGVLDTGSFYRQCEAEWWPPLRAVYPDHATIPANELTTEQRMIQLVHRPVQAPPKIWNVYPSHLHINILPPGQGRGYGRALIETLLAALSTAGSPGVFLGLQPNNETAPGFYEHLGFVWLPVIPGANRRMALKLPYQPLGQLIRSDSP